MKKTLVTVCLILTTMCNAYAHTETLHSDKKHISKLFDIFKKNEKEDQNVNADPSKTKKKFNTIIDRVVRLYSKDIKKRKAKLKVDKYWESNVVNAFAEKDGNKWRILFLGGLYRTPSLTDDALALATCHEIGHLIGGTPFVEGGESEMSVEGQADFWGAAVCLKKYFHNFPETIYMEEGFAKYTCDTQYYGDEDAKNICYRTIMAGQSVLNTVTSPKKLPSNFDTPDDSQVSYTTHNYPGAQCRFDTYVAGALCNLDDSCNEKRPRCWFKKHDQ